MACTSDQCAGRYGKCGGHYWSNGSSESPTEKLSLKQCCDPAFECVQYRHTYFQCRPKQRSALANWNNAVHTCSAPPSRHTLRTVRAHVQCAPSPHPLHTVRANCPMVVGETAGGS